jgi:hypothetical protein
LTQETRAYGWLMRLQNRADGIYGQIKWTATGQQAVDGGDYRFFSTEYAQSDLQILNRGETPLRVRPLKLDGLSLTNAPNNRGAAPITNRGGESGPEDALREFSQAVKQMQAERGMSFEKAWDAVKRERPALAQALVQRPAAVQSPRNRAEAAEEDAATAASNLLRELAQKHAAATNEGFASCWSSVCGRFPNLVAIANRRSGYDGKLADSEAAARKAYLKACASSERISHPHTAWKNGTVSVMEAMLANWDRGAADFLNKLQKLMIEYPEFGAEERLDKLKESDPDTYWNFVDYIAGESEPLERLFSKGLHPWDKSE